MGSGKWLNRTDKVRMNDLFDRDLSIFVYTHTHTYFVYIYVLFV